MRFARRALLIVGVLALQGPMGGSAYDALHMVNLQKVVCETDSYVEIELDTTQIMTDPYKPYVVTFLRSSNLEMIVTYSLVNSQGGQWSQGALAVTLDGLDVRRLASIEERNITTPSSISKAADDEVSERRLAGRRRSSSSRSPPPRRRASTPRRRRSSPPRRRRAPKTPPPRRRAAAVPRRRAATSAAGATTTAPRRRATVSPRRRGAPPAAVGPRRRNSAYQPPGAPAGTPNRYSTGSTGGTGYGYTNQQQMYGNYGNNAPGYSSYGYSGHSSYNSGSSPGMYFAAGALTGAMVGVGGYYMYQRMQYGSCGGYGCCYGCSNACYNSYRSNCNMQMNRQYYRDDLMTDSGFIPADEASGNAADSKWPLKIRIFSVAGDAVAGANRDGLCPPTGCTDENCSVPATEPQDLFVTLTMLDELGDVVGSASGATRSAGMPGITALPALVLLALAVQRALHW